MIEGRKLYPITYLKGVRNSFKDRLASAGLILLRDVVEEDIQEIRRKTGLPKEILERIIQKARIILFE
ncbi:MAG: hypothetical protein DRN12_03950 [Thermoplasmata archaeon]|nr:MAG: hypothetical protein DRN12_03950 [Thermoplasmata archaeon]